MAEQPVTSPVACTRHLPTLCLGGAWQMAIDAWLLELGQPALRLYRWRRPCVSLGRHQRRFPRHWLDLAAAGRLDLVRRPSGGGAVLHGGDLSYALVWPRPPADRLRAYHQACAWLQHAFEELGQPLCFGEEPATLAAASCFASRTAADLVDAEGRKRIGSAQLWRAGCLLQQGTIQLAPDPELWRLLFAADPPALPALPVKGDQLETVLIAAARQLLPLPPLWHQRLWARELAAIAPRLAQMRPGVDADPPAPASTASPEASIERTTCGSARPRG